MNTNLLVTVVIPTYKRNIKMLQKAVDSVLRQTYKNIEIIVIDDNGSEKTTEFRKQNVKFLKEKCSEDKRISYIFNEKNIGGALSRNVGIKAAKGELITFLDDDDVFLPQKIEHQVKFMVENNLNCSFTDLSIYNEEDKLIDRRVRNDIKLFDREYLIKYHLTKIISSTETFMVSKKLLLDIGGFDDAVAGHEFYLMFKILQYPDLKIGYFESDDIKAYRTKGEAISTGPNKIIGEKQLYEFKKKYFNLLSLKERRYVKCRHWAVMAVAYKRNNKLIKAIFCLILSFITSPITAFQEAFKLKKKIS